MGDPDARPASSRFAFCVTVTEESDPMRYAPLALILMACGATDPASIEHQDAPLARGGSPEVWIGVLQNYGLASGSSKVTLTFTRQGSDITGTLFFGDGPALAPPADPEVGYPAGVGFPVNPSALSERFPFTIVGGTFDGTHLAMDMRPTEIWDAWCALQTTVYPYFNGGSATNGELLGYACLPNASLHAGPGGCAWSDDGNATFHAADCGKIGLCTQRVCVCDSTRCTGTSDAASIHFDLVVDANEAAGNVSFGAPPGIAVTFTRAP